VSICKAGAVKEGNIVRNYQDLFEARFAEVRHDYRTANEGRGYSRPGTLRTFIRRITAR